MKPENRSKMLMTPGPTEIPERVRKAMSRKIHNPDIEEDFKEFHRNLEDKIRKVYQTDKDIVILGGEGILGLEASIASVLEEGDKVLCISNGLYGDYFADFVDMYGGKPIMCKFPYGSSIDNEKVKLFLEEEDFKVSTIVHCETPTGTLNNIEETLKILKEEGIITVVDAVSSLGGVPVPTENMDICICGSQKCLSSPPGLATLSISEVAWRAIQKKNQKTHYTNLLLWKEMWKEENYFPYTPLVSNLYALEQSAEIILEEGKEKVHNRHKEAAELCRDIGQDIGLELFPESEDISSPTVTAFHTEDRALELQERVYEDHDILLATGLQDLENDIIRVGHMGYNADREKVRTTMNALKEEI